MKRSDQSTDHSSSPLPAMSIDDLRNWVKYQGSVAAQAGETRYSFSASPMKHADYNTESPSYDPLHTEGEEHCPTRLLLSDYDLAHLSCDTRNTLKHKVVPRKISVEVAAAFTAILNGVSKSDITSAGSIKDVLDEVSKKAMFPSTPASQCGRYGPV